jgi:putative aminopeptidase FrvX
MKEQHELIGQKRIWKADVFSKHMRTVPFIVRNISEHGVLYFNYVGTSKMWTTSKKDIEINSVELSPVMEALFLE